jgi:hypothetical protein
MQLTENEINLYAADFGVQFQGAELQKLHGLLNNIPSVAMQKRVLLRFLEDCALGAIHHEMASGAVGLIKSVDNNTKNQIIHGTGKS